MVNVSLKEGMKERKEGMEGRLRGKTRKKHVSA